MLGVGARSGCVKSFKKRNIPFIAINKSVYLRTFGSPMLVLRSFCRLLYTKSKAGAAFTLSERSESKGRGDCACLPAGRERIVEALVSSGG